MGPFTWRLPEGIDLDARLVPPTRVTAYADAATRRGLYQDLARRRPELDSLREGAEVARLRRRCHAKHSRALDTGAARGRARHGDGRGVAAEPPLCGRAGGGR